MSRWKRSNPQPRTAELSPQPVFRTAATSRPAPPPRTVLVGPLWFLTMTIFLLSWASDCAATGREVDRSPVDLILAPDESWLVTVNQTANTASLVRVADGVVLDEVSVGRKPVSIALFPDGHRVLISSCDAGELTCFEVKQEKLIRCQKIFVGFHPHGMAISSDGRRAYVALSAAAQVAVVDLERGRVVDRIDVGRWPRFLALSPDESRLAVGTSGDRGVSVVDLDARKLMFTEKFVGLNIGHLEISQDGQSVYFPWVVYRRNPVTEANIRLGWVLATRLGRVRLDGPARREAVSLDPQGRAVADPHGLALSKDGERVVISASGTHELLVLRRPDLPFMDYGGTDHIPRELLEDESRFARIELGGRPMGLRMGADDRTVYVANYLENSVQVVDVERRQLIRSISLGGPSEPSLARRGEAIFYDARRSLDQWYSCHTCHYEGGTNAVIMDTFNDRSPFSFKSVLPLQNVTKTAPWTWHGWQTDFRDAMATSLTSTMVGPVPNEQDLDALIAYMDSLELPPNPFRGDDGQLDEVARRGERIFYSEQANCASCHTGEYLTDGQIHDVGTGTAIDRLDGFNTPSLRGVYRKVILLHDGREESLESLLIGPHSPEIVSGNEPLTESQVRDLVAYLRSL